MSEGRTVAGAVAFLLVVWLIVSSAGGDYPELAMANPTPTIQAIGAPNLGAWFSTDAPGCDVTLACMNVVLFWTMQPFIFLANAIGYMGNLVMAVFSLFISIMTFSVPAFADAPPPMPFVGIAIAVLMWVVFAWIVLNLIIRIFGAVMP